jgi:hypothetical protein
MAIYMTKMRLDWNVGCVSVVYLLEAIYAEWNSCSSFLGIAACKRRTPSKSLKILTIPVCNGVELGHSKCLLLTCRIRKVAANPGK